LNAVWADDFHHSVEVALMEGSMYAGTFEGKLHEHFSVAPSPIVHQQLWEA